MSVTQDRELAERARAWRTALLESVCDVIEPWAHGTIYRATHYPSFFEYNVVQVQDRAAIGAEEIAAIADEALTGLAHRKIGFDYAETGEPLRAELRARGWLSERLISLLHSGRWPPASRGPERGAAVVLAEVPYDAVDHLRGQWHQEDFPGDDPTAFHAAAKRVALRQGARVFAASQDAIPVAFAQIIGLGSRMEIDQVYVRAEDRGRGLGTAVTSAAIRAAAGADELWISADEEKRAKDLYMRLGFRPARTTVDFLRTPPAVSGPSSPPGPA